MKKSTKLSIFLVLLSMLALSTANAASITVSGTTYYLNSNTTSSALDSTAGTQSTANDTGIAFNGVAINMATTIAAVTKSDHIRVDDNRGTNAGWNVTVSASDFTTTVTDLSGTSAGNVTVAIPANTILTLSSQTPAFLFNSELANVTAQSTSSTAVTSGSGIKVLSAAKGYGQGVYKQQLDYSLTMPNYLPPSTVITSTATGSQFIPANRTGNPKIGLFAGTYNSTITYSITTGP